MAMKEQYYTIDGQIVGYETTLGRRDVLVDNLGSVTAEMDQTGNNQTYAGRYKPFGQTESSTGTSGRFGWIGTLGYRSTGLKASSHYVRARHYSKVSGSWTSTDPLWPYMPAYSYVFQQVTRLTDALGLEPDKGGSSGKPGFPEPLSPSGECSQRRCGTTETTRSTRDLNPQSRPGQQVSISAEPFGVGLSWSGTSRVVVTDAFWTIAKWKCQCTPFISCTIKGTFANWVLTGKKHCKGTHFKEDIRVGTQTIIIREEYHSDGSPGCPKEEIVQDLKGNLAAKICKSLGWPDFICNKLNGGFF